MTWNSGIIYSTYTDRELYSIMFDAAQEGAFVSHIRGKMCDDIDGFFREVSSSMRFPYYFGWNWAAFDECITDLEWLNCASYFMVIDNYDFFFSHDALKEDNKKLVLKYLRKAVNYWQSKNVQFVIIINR